MHISVSLLIRPIFFCVLAAFSFFFLVGGYNALRVIRIPINWVIWIIGTLILTISLTICLAIALPDQFTFPGMGRYSNFIGIVSLLIAVYAASQWTTRQWYVLIKKRAASWLVQQSRNILLFVRSQHQFFGWLVVIAAVGHIAYYLPAFSSFKSFKFVTGFIAIGILALIALLGLWMWIATSLRKKRMPKSVHTLHAALAIAFFVILAVHVA